MKPGYKHTEVGVIPEEWEVVLLIDIAEIVSGGTPNTNVSEYWNGEIQWCTPTDLTRNDKKYIYNTERTITKEGLAKSGAQILPEGTLLLCSRATIGVVKISGVELCTNQGFKSLICREKVNNNFLYYNINTQKNKLIERAFGSTFLEISTRNVASLPIALPPLPEQRAIAEALSDVDAVLAEQDRLIAKKRDMKHAVMQELLTGKTRLPGFSEPWEVKRLGEVSRIQRGASPRPIDSPVWFDNTSLIGWLRISDVTSSGVYLYNTSQFLSREGISNSRYVESGNLVMSICATIGRPVITKINVCIHDGFVVFDELRSDVNYMYYVLKFIEPFWRKHGQTGSQMNLNTGIINDTEFLLPEIEEQVAIATVLSDLDAELDALEALREKTRLVKQGMMQELLTGQIRLVP